jgi:integrase
MAKSKYDWHSSNFKGVRFREHPTRKVAVGAVKYPDKYFVIRYQKDGERVEEGLGWASSPDKWTAEKAFTKLTVLKDAAKNQKPDSPTRLSEEREYNAEKKILAGEERERQQEERQRKELDNITAKRFFYDTYWPTIPTHRKEGSQLHDETHFRLWLGPVIGDKPLKSIAPLHLERIKKNMQDAKKSPRTIQYVFATFRQIWNMAKAAKIVSDESPTKSVKLPKINNTRERFLTQVEANTLFTALKARDLTAYQMAVLSLYTGVRASEIFKLTWGDVNRERGTIYIKYPKNHESRYVHITKPIAALLDSMTEGKPQELLFSISMGKTKGHAYNEAPSTFAETVKALGLNDGITDDKQKVVFHTLRHTFSSWIVEKGTSLYTLTKLTGHKTLSMGARYAHLADNTLRDAARLIENNEEIDGEMAEESSSNVIQLRGQA